MKLKNTRILKSAPVRSGGRAMRLKPSPRAVDAIVVGADPLAQITIYPDMTILTRRDGPRWLQYPIRPEALASLLGKLPASTGLLPPFTLGTGAVNGESLFAVYVPPRQATLKLDGGTSYTIPLPPLVWAGCGQAYRLWALDTIKYPSNGGVTLFRAPFPNVYPDGSICWGSSDARPIAAPGTMMRVLKLFLEESLFNLHLANGKSVHFSASVVGRWQQLVESQADAYPLDDLIPAERSLGWLLAGGPWGGAR